MKEHPTIYVVWSYDDAIIEGWYDENEAIKSAQDLCAEQMLDPRDWDSYYQITPIKVKR